MMTETNRSIFGINKGRSKKNYMWYTRRSWGMTYHVLIPSVMFDLQELISQTLTKIDA